MLSRALVLRTLSVSLTSGGPYLWWSLTSGVYYRYSLLLYWRMKEEMEQGLFSLLPQGKREMTAFYTSWKSAKTV